MELQFNPNLDFQREAIDSVVDLFDGQEICKTNFTVMPLKHDPQTSFSKIENDLGVGNRLLLPEEEIHKNVKDIQLRNGLAPSEELKSMDFTVEMETGTGKTYVYLRSIFEMNRLYGFTKFIVVVPSIAIKEGVYKSLQMTAEHFKGLYDNTQFDYFVYDSQKLGQVRNFATNEYIQIMVINIDAFRKSFKDPEKKDKANIIHRPHDRMTGRCPIEFIQQTSPIVIIDEPQSVDTTEKSREAINSLHPLCTLRYSATHIDKHHMMYKLDSIDAYERKLVKQIEVAGIEAKDSFNKAYIKLLKVDNRKSPIRAQIELDVSQGGGVARKTKWVRSGDDLLEFSKGRDIYDGYIVEEIYCEEGNEYISFTSKPDIIGLNEVVGGIDDDEYKRMQIRKTIEEHLDKELQLRPQGLKVLSLFFIDRVANYRDYDADGHPVQGKYAKKFEEEYKRAIRKPKYNILFEGVDLETSVEGVHDGYFAIDKKKTDATGKGRFKESRGAGTTKADESAYNTIMKNKEWLLSLDCKLKFIFSHSALREGWDNPNVFQICTLNETGSVLKKRQEIGRGLRIAVNQNGERVQGFDVNRLTVMANESYEDFAKKLQSEIEKEENIKFGIVEKHLFANIPVPTGDHETRYVGMETSRNVWEHLEKQGYIDSRGKVQDALRKGLKAGKVDLPEEVEDYQAQIISALRKVAGGLNIKNADDRKRVKLNKAIYLSDEFKELWDRIKCRTSFRVDFDTEKLIAECVDEIRKSLVVGRTRLTVRKGLLEIDRGGVHGETTHETTAVSEVRDYLLPDIISYLQNETNLTRRTLVRIMTESGRLNDFENNPQKYIEQVASIIKHRMRLFIVDGIKYQKLGGNHYFAQELFEENELFGYLSKNMIGTKKSVYDHVVYDSDVEQEFARSFELNDEIKVYAKLPPWFNIDTPLGGYNPDWAVLVEKDGLSRLYFVVESKGSLFPETLRPKEQAKIDCGREHFKALETSVDFAVANNFDKFSQIISSK